MRFFSAKPDFDANWPFPTLLVMRMDQWSGRQASHSLIFLCLFTSWSHSNTLSGFLELSHKQLQTTCISSRIEADNRDIRKHVSMKGYICSFYVFPHILMCVDSNTEEICLACKQSGKLLNSVHFLFLMAFVAV